MPYVELLELHLAQGLHTLDRNEKVVKIRDLATAIRIPVGALVPGVDIGPHTTLWGCREAHDPPIRIRIGPVCHTWGPDLPVHINAVIHDLRAPREYLHPALASEPLADDVAEGGVIHLVVLLRIHQPPIVTKAIQHLPHLVQVYRIPRFGHFAYAADVPQRYPRENPRVEKSPLRIAHTWGAAAVLALLPGGGSIGIHADQPLYQRKIYTKETRQ